MDKYDLGSGLDMGRVEVIQSTNLSDFPELTLISWINASKEQKRDSPWGVTTGGSIATKPVVHNGVVYFGCNDHNFYAVDAGTGKELWRFGTNGPVGVWGSASIWRNRIMFSSFDGNVYCLSLDGRLLWKFGTGGEITATPVVHGDVVYFGSRDRKMYAVSAETGEEVWRLPLDEEFSGSILLYEGSLYFGARDGVYRISPDGRLVWKFPLKGDVDEELAAQGDTIYFGCTDKNVYAVSTKGRLVWRSDTGGPVISDIKLHDGRLYVGSYDNNMYCLDLKGKILWRFPTGDIVYSPVIHGDRICFVSFDKCLYCLTLDGRLVWKLLLEAMSYPTARDGVFYVSGWDCKLRAISTEGRILWEFQTSMSRQSELNFELGGDEGFEVVWKQPSLRDEGEKRKEEQALGDYGDFKGSYIQDDMRDYMGSSLDRGSGPGMAYRAGKRVYRK